MIYSTQIRATKQCNQTALQTEILQTVLNKIYLKKREAKLLFLNKKLKLKLISMPI